MAQAILKLLSLEEKSFTLDEEKRGRMCLRRDPEICGQKGRM
jgi:hypothetical protein